MDKKPVILMTLAKNNLAGVPNEAENIYNSVQSNNLVKAVKIEDADIDTLAENIIDNNDELLVFHYGGHADQHSIVLDGFRNLDKIRLSRLLLPIENHRLFIVFLNGCLTYGQVGLLTAKGVKAIIATNVEVNDAEAVRLSKFFYKSFFENNGTLQSAFEFAEATVKGKNSYPIVVNPGEIDETQSMPSSWTLFVHSKYTEVLNWTLKNFIDYQNRISSISTNKPTKPISTFKQYIYISETKLDMYLSQLYHGNRNNISQPTNLYDKLELFNQFYKNNIDLLDSDFIEDDLMMFCEIIEDEKHSSSYIYFGSTNGKIALFGSPKHMIGNSTNINSKFSSQFSWYVSEQIFDAVSNAIKSPLRDRNYHNFALHIKRINEELGTFPQKFKFLAKPIYYFENCILATPIYVAFSK